MSWGLTGLPTGGGGSPPGGSGIPTLWKAGAWGEPERDSHAEATSPFLTPAGESRGTAPAHPQGDPSARLGHTERAGGETDPPPPRLNVAQTELSSFPQAQPCPHAASGSKPQRALLVVGHTPCPPPSPLPRGSRPSPRASRQAIRSWRSHGMGASEADPHPPHCLIPQRALINGEIGPLIPGRRGGRMPITETGPDSLSRGHATNRQRQAYVTPSQGLQRGR